MIEAPSPTHGHLRVVLLFWLSLFAVPVGLREFGASGAVLFVAAVAAGALLFRAVAPPFRRFRPERPR